MAHMLPMSCPANLPTSAQQAPVVPLARNLLEGQETSLVAE